MLKEKYEQTELEIIEFRSDDVLLTSECTADDSQYETSKIQ